MTGKVVVPTLASIRKSLDAEAAKPKCPNVAEHTPHPSGYVNHSAWADRKMEQGWTQRECPGCGTWAIWIPPKATP